MSDNKNNKCQCGPGYATPLDAMQNGPREKILYVVTVQPNTDEPHGDYLSTVDVDPSSSTYCQVIHRTFTNRKGNELHHSGWNTCSSCHDIKSDNMEVIPKRDKLILPCLISDFIYVIDVGKNPKQPEIYKEINGDILKSYNCSAPHTTHCLPNGNVMISTMGDVNGKAKGEFILFDSKFNCIGTWTKGDKVALCGYDYWYQPYFDVMVSSEWGAPELFRRGYKTSDLDDMTQYGRRLNFYQWSTQKLIQTIDLGENGTTPLEIRFLHDPKEPQGYVGTALYSKVYHFKKISNKLEFEVNKVIDIPTKKIKLPDNSEMDLNGMLTDILISLDDKFLYLSNWLHGDIRQYDITDRQQPKLTGQLFIGGKILNDSKIQLINDDMELPKPTVIKGRRLCGGPQMLQLSLDGKRLYVSSSLFSPWDKQFYPQMVENGGTIVQIDCLPNGGMILNENFLVDFGKNEPYGATLPHEMRYPGGDCTSDIWLSKD